MKQPMLCNWLTIKDYRFNNATITNEVTDEKYTTNEGSAFIQFIRQLDGKTDPYSIQCPYSYQERTIILDELTKLGLIRRGRWLNKSLSCLAYSLIIPRKQKTNSLLLKLLNVVLYLSFLPTFILGFSSFISSFYTFHLVQISMPGIVIGLLLGIICHECAHAIASLAYGGTVYEAGVMLSNLVIPGAYVITKDAGDLSAAKRIQIVAGGPEANLILSGAAFSLLSKNPNMADFYFCIALINLGLAFLNLVLRQGNDGCHILSYLFGAESEDIVNVAKDTVIHKINRMKLYHSGSVGFATLCTYILILLFQIVTPVIIILNIMGVISWFG